MKGRHYMNLGEIDLKMLYRTWKSELGPFQCFFRSTPFVSLQTYDNFELSEGNINEFSENILKNIIKNCNEKNFLIVDLLLDDILDLALILNNEYCIKPILNINLLFHPFGVIGSQNNINKLINNGLKLKKINSKKFVMLVPYDRYDDNLKTEDLKEYLNNQYGIGDDDLPYVEMLKEMGYNKVTILTQDEIKADLKEYMNYIEKDIRVEIIKVMM
jgi:glutaredoxin-related protein